MSPALLIRGQILQMHIVHIDTAHASTAVLDVSATLPRHIYGMLQSFLQPLEYTGKVECTAFLELHDEI